MIGYTIGATVTQIGYPVFGDVPLGAYRATARAACRAHPQTRAFTISSKESISRNS